MLSAATSEAVLAVGKYSCHLSKLGSLQIQSHNLSNSSYGNSYNLKFSTSSYSKSPSKLINYYEVLGIAKNASTEDIRNAFLKLSKNYHPDINSTDPQNHDRFIEINDAYSVLSKPLLRREYDHSQLNPRHHNIHHQYSSSNGFKQTFHRFHERQSYGHAYDPQFYAYRDKSKDEYYAKYGVSGFSKFSDRKIVYLCIGIVLFGASFHFFVTKTLSDMHIEHLNARDKKTHVLWTNANDPNFIADQLERIKEKVAEEEAKKYKK